MIRDMNVRSYLKLKEEDQGQELLLIVKDVLALIIDNFPLLEFLTDLLSILAYLRTFTVILIVEISV